MLYYSTYNTGTFECCNYVVYEPPTRNYKFDPLFAQPQNLPPGTPMFRDIDNLDVPPGFHSVLNTSGESNPAPILLQARGLFFTHRIAVGHFDEVAKDAPKMSSNAACPVSSF